MGAQSEKGDLRNLVTAHNLKIMYFSRCGPQNQSTGITWELVRNVK